MLLLCAMLAPRKLEAFATAPAPSVQVGVYDATRFATALARRPPRRSALTRSGSTGRRPTALLLLRTREANRRPVTTAISQAAQLVAECLRGYRTDAQRLSRRGAGSPYTPTTPTLAVKVGPSAHACGAPLTGSPDSRLRRCSAGACPHPAPEAPVMRTGTSSSPLRALTISHRLQITPDFA
jgi:hypothetical protein